MSVRVAELMTGAIRRYPLPAGGCAESTGPVRLSPDGRHAALAFHRFLTGGRSELRVAVVDLDRGTVVADRRIVGPATVRLLETGSPGITSSRGAIVGLAWDDPTSLRVAWYEAPAEGLHWMTDLIQVTALSVP
jgi:hypothetical protein